MKNKVIGWGVVFVVVCVGAFLLSVQRTNRQKTEQQAAITQALVAIVNDFHTEIGEILPTGDRAQSMEKLNTVKAKAATAREGLNDLKARAYVLGDEAWLLHDALKRSDNYLKRFEGLVEKSASAKNMTDAAEEMTQCLSRLSTTVHAADCPGKSDTGTAIERCQKIAANYFAPIVTKPTQMIEASSRYWSNPSYTGYHQAIRSIVAEYVAGRRVLSTVLTHYDRGTLTYDDRRSWSREIERRQLLLERLDSIYRTIPPGSVYDDHHGVLRGMLQDALAAMEAFAQNESYNTRRQLSRVSEINTRIMNTRLKPFYGIR